MGRAPTHAQLRATEEMALIVEDIAGAPGDEHRGVEFWVAVARKICKKHGCRSLALKEEDQSGTV